jgi:hypothetical protein
MAKEFKITIIDVQNKQKIFDDWESFYDFSKTELEFWKAVFTNKTYGSRKNVANTWNTFNSVVSTMDQWKAEISSQDEAAYNQRMAQLKQIASGLNNNWVWSQSPAVRRWQEIFQKISPPAADGFFESYFGNSSSNPTSYDNLRGYILAYEYQLQGETHIVSRREAERQSFEGLMDDLENRRNNLFGRINDTQADIDRWVATTKKGFEIWHKEAGVNLSAQLADEKQKLETQIINQENIFKSHESEWKAKKIELEQTYERLLKLKKPAEYWNKRATTLRWQAGLWSIALVASVALPLFYLHEFFILWLQGQKLPLQLNTFQGAIIFASILSAFAVLIKALSRLTFSAFHLQRDAEEREQLTYVYLSLSNEGKVNPETINLVLQSLFSRSESGLLSGESGPTMPTLGEVVTATARVGRP